MNDASDMVLKIKSIIKTPASDKVPKLKSKSKIWFTEEMEARFFDAES